MYHQIEKHQNFRSKWGMAQKRLKNTGLDIQQPSFSKLTKQRKVEATIEWAVRDDVRVASFFNFCRLQFDMTDSCGNDLKSKACEKQLNVFSKVTSKKAKQKRNFSKVKFIEISIKIFAIMLLFWVSSLLIMFI